MYPVNLMMKMCHVFIRQCKGYTQHKPGVVDYCEPFPDFAPDPGSVCSKEKFLRNYNYHGLIVKVLLTLGLHAVFIEFVKFMGNFCQVFAAYKRVRDSMAFLYQIGGILL